MLKEVIAAVTTVAVFCGGVVGFFCETAREIPTMDVIATGTTVPIATTTTTPIATTITTVAVATSTTTETTTTTEMTTTELTTTETATEEMPETTTTSDSTELNADNVSWDTYLLAYAMAREAADMTDAAYVGCVILNRVDDPDFPDSIEAVLEQPGQYPWGDPYYSESYIYDPEFYELAEQLMEGYRPLPQNVVYQAQFPQGSGTYTTYGVHYYCYK